MLLVNVNVVVCDIEPEAAVIVTVEVCVVWPLDTELPQAVAPIARAIAMAIIESRPKRRRHFRVRLRNQRPNPRAAKVKGARPPLKSGPAMADVVPENATVVLTGAPAGVTFAGLKLHEMPGGSPEQAKVTTASKPLTGVTVMLAVAGVELVSVPLPGLIDSENSGGGGAEIVTVTAAEMLPLKLVSPP